MPGSAPLVEIGIGDARAGPVNLRLPPAVRLRPSPPGLQNDLDPGNLRLIAQVTLGGGDQPCFSSFMAAMRFIVFQAPLRLTRR